ncbi:hypothetical protein Pmar_PMAR024820 [Perkinsus marinus ATCC 50983]|uniref:DNA replication factor Dna2 N-terminal domain-containing protein n=1 Tax=Perkinsus marinus (strain ATCC 50983 / TXsc) TaxID=423536 RepID=C5M194_PERM5|nr:hypothetical protein Pmar_PMAR024820 [Perkinsus marinus ATCC 50983]EEQ97324.1 hypothetical protein Pmar_PMAR024820 [Perkinsus marinus ATCC 50983]|eukprot:XP_002764607.1 hypothetical protein Pmar_PMAR024820 [Perkinsus marinus ATCC 50983]
MLGRVDEAFVRHVVDSAKMDLWFSGFSNTSMLERHVRERVPQVAQWLTEVVPKKFSRLIAAEQNVNCRKFGLKGKIDAVVETAAGRQQGLTCLEIKTGKPWHTHLGQVTLYHLLMMDLNLRGPPGGGAAAPACAEINEVTPSPTELDNLMCVRNTLALHLARKSLPATIGTKRECERWISVLHCVLDLILYLVEIHA